MPAIKPFGKTVKLLNMAFLILLKVSIKMHSHDEEDSFDNWTGYSFDEPVT